ncbi:MAG: hypothetical protein IH627_22040 [Rubrivivax sp.]|nr:hypothetical protein [Rubrivivax sp.]
MRSIISLIVPLLVVPSAVFADDSGLQRCRGLADPTARLACYDALGSAPSADVQGQRFGLKAPPSEAMQAVVSHIPGKFEGWEPKSRIRLANGQVWQIVDGSRGAFQLVDAKVRVRRGALGSYYLDIEGHNTSPGVKRVE